MRTFTACAALVTAGCGDIAPNADAGDASTVDSGKADSARADSGDAGNRIPLHHRATDVPCPTQRGPGPPTQPYSQGNGCLQDSDCTAGKNGRCFPFEGLVGPGGCPTTNASATRIVARRHHVSAARRPPTTRPTSVTREAIVRWTPTAGSVVIARLRGRPAVSPITSVTRRATRASTTPTVPPPTRVQGVRRPQRARSTRWSGRARR